MAVVYSQYGVIISKSLVNCSSLFKGIIQYDSINKLITYGGGGTQTEVNYITATGLDFSDPVNENFVIQLQFRYSTSPANYIGFIGVKKKGINYQNIAFHYNKINHTYWIGIPNSDNTDWQDIVNWKEYEFSPDTWYTIKLKFINSTKTLEVYINSLLDISAIVENPTKFKDTIAFGCNWNEKYLAYMTIDVDKTYISIGDKLAWKFSPIESGM